MRGLLLFVFSLHLMAAPSDDFIIRVKTDNPGVSSDTEFTIPITTTNGAGYNVTCDDPGVVSSINETGSYTCIYGSAGTYDIRLSDANGDKKGFRRIQFYVNSTTQTDALKLIDIKQWGTAIWSSMYSAFRGADNTIASATDVPDLSAVGSLGSMFRDCALVDPDTSSWDVSNITNLSYMFRNAGSADPDVSSWDTANVTNMAGMFYNAVSAQPTTTTSANIWNTASVTNMRDMFRGAILADPDVSNWDTANVTNLYGMFYGAANAQPVTTTSGNIWNTSSVTDMGTMFRDATNANPDVSHWDTANVTRFTSMFQSAVNAQPVTTTSGNIWNTSSATAMRYMFRDATDANPDVSGWDTSNVTNFLGMFYGAVNAQPVTTTSGSIWNTSSATTMRYMFRNATDANPDVSGWDTANVTDFLGMFHSAVNAQPVTTTSGNIWDTSSATTMRYMFRNATDADPDVSGWDTANVTDFLGMFYGASNAYPDVSGWDTSSATDMRYMFRDAYLAEPDTSGWDTANVTTMRAMFRNASEADPDVSGWDVSQVTDMAAMFRDTQKADPDVNSWTTSSVTNMNDMFHDASAFKHDVSGWDVSSLTTALRMFRGIVLSIEHYDALLNGWDAQSLQDGVGFGADNSCYLTAESARNNMQSSDNWTITDNGKCVPCGAAQGDLIAMHWKVVSFACDTGSNSISDLLSGTLGVYGDENDWVMYAQKNLYTAHPTNDMRLLAATDTVTPDRGYWIISTNDVSWSVDTSLAGLAYTSVQPASNLGISNSVFDDVNLTELPDSSNTQSNKVLLGNPFAKKMQLSDLYFSHAGSAYNPMSNDAAGPNYDYIQPTVYVYDHTGTSSTNYTAIVPDTPGFSDRLEVMMGFWIELKSNQTGSNFITYPLEK